MPLQPDLSIIIPTTGTRPRLLQKAILSSLESSPSNNMEIIVVANGANDPKIALNDFRVKKIHLTEKNGNIARNAGLQLATGKFIRFLDDDDFLCPEGATLQYQALAHSGADICTGGIRFLNEDLEEIGSYMPGNGCDLVTEIFQQRASTLLHAHLYRREFLAGLTWDPERGFLQDVAWLHQLIQRGEAKWLPIQSHIGAWVHHGKERISTKTARLLGEEHLLMAAQIIGASIEALDVAGRMNDTRRRAAAKALWDYAHQGFSWTPHKWVKFARWADILAPGARSSSKVMNTPLLRWMDPITAEYLLFPLRSAVRKWGNINAA